MLKKLLIYIEYQKLLPESELVSRRLEGKAEAVVEGHAQRTEKTELSGYSREGLVITDSEEMARRCIAERLPVLIYLHAHNKNGNFQEIMYAIEDLTAISYEYLNRIYDRYHGNPWTILETERCIVREMTVKDAAAIYDIYKGKSAAHYMEKLPLEQAEYEEYIRNYIEYGYRFYEYGMWVVEEKRSGKVIGRAGIEWKEDIEGAELGYVIEDSRQRRGFAYESCRAIVGYAVSELGFTSLYIIAEEGNIPSERLACKLGFAPKKILVRQNKVCRVYKYHCKKRIERIQ